METRERRRRQARLLLMLLLCGKGGRGVPRQGSPTSSGAAGTRAGSHLPRPHPAAPPARHGSRPARRARLRNAGWGRACSSQPRCRGSRCRRAGDGLPGRHPERAEAAQVRLPLRWYYETFTNCTEVETNVVGCYWPNPLAQGFISGVHRQFFANCTVDRTHWEDPPDEVLIPLIAVPVLLTVAMAGLVVWRSKRPDQLL
ncbi:receptor activity-modifying protein 3 [Eumetopias jubatus]|uniref:receptor activity-modifying protein 3 n=1 Tax=Eumetopias jubatus TaxID=34886 RepID=UPI0010161CDF|nr:receptor activity-modifying protein 3 [Eumetopias jubatus]